MIITTIICSTLLIVIIASLLFVKWLSEFEEKIDIENKCPVLLQYQQTKYEYYQGNVTRDIGSNIRCVLENNHSGPHNIDDKWWSNDKREVIHHEI